MVVTPPHFVSTPTPMSLGAVSLPADAPFLDRTTPRDESVSPWPDLCSRLRIESGRRVVRFAFGPLKVFLLVR